MKKPLIMTPGPTYISEDVRKAMAEEIANPDLDLGFFEFYRETAEKLQKLLHTGNSVLIMCGEGILGLEAACCSLIEKGDRVLCIDNGIFGRGFGDFAAIYGAEVSYYRSDYRRPLDPGALEAFLKAHPGFKLATLVHCETPSGLTNPVEDICPVLKKYGIITVVDSVSAVGGERLETDDWKIDVLLGGSQKCLSAAPGLTFMSVSKDAWDKILGRNTPAGGFYCNISNWKSWYEDKWFPYTQPVSDIYGLSAAADKLLEEGDPALRHERLAKAVRSSITASGLELYPESGFSNTVTAVLVPGGVTYEQINDIMLSRYNVMIAGAFDFLKGKVLRIGHMGENCHEEKLYTALKALDGTLKTLGVAVDGKIHRRFIEALD